MKQHSHQNNWKLQAAVIFTCIMQGITGFVLEARSIFSGWVGLTSVQQAMCQPTQSSASSLLPPDSSAYAVTLLLWNWGGCRASCLSTSALCHVSRSSSSEGVAGAWLVSRQRQSQPVSISADVALRSSGMMSLAFFRASIRQQSLCGPSAGHNL